MEQVLYNDFKAMMGMGRHLLTSPIDWWVVTNNKIYNNIIIKTINMKVKLLEFEVSFE